MGSGSPGRNRSTPPREGRAALTTLPGRRRTRRSSSRTPASRSPICVTRTSPGPRARRSVRELIETLTESAGGDTRERLVAVGGRDGDVHRVRLVVRRQTPRGRPCPPAPSGVTFVSTVSTTWDVRYISGVVPGRTMTIRSPSCVRNFTISFCADTSRSAASPSRYSTTSEFHGFLTRAISPSCDSISTYWTSPDLDRGRHQESVLGEQLVLRIPRLRPRREDADHRVAHRSRS